MPTFVYTGADARTFPDAGLVVEPGDTVEADGNPDPRFFKPAKKSKPEPIEEP